MTTKRSPQRPQGAAPWFSAFTCMVLSGCMVFIIIKNQHLSKDNADLRLASIIADKRSQIAVTSTASAFEEGYFQSAMDMYCHRNHYAFSSSPDGKITAWKKSSGTDADVPVEPTHAKK